jgi:hypothetical protein
MLGFNGGLMGKRRKQEATTPGLWFPNERAIIVGSDPYWDNVVLLLQPNEEANNSTVFTDLSSYGRTLTANGNVKIDTSVTRFGRPTILADGTGDTISAADSASLELSSSNFTLEMWLEPFSQTRQYVTLIGRSDLNYAGGTWVLVVNNASATSGDVLLYAENNAIALQTTGVDVRDGNAHFIQVVRTGNVFDINVDGTNRATTTNNVAFGNSTFPLKIMGEDGSSPNRDAAANVGAVRLTIGVARPNVVPTGPFPVY